MTDQTKTIKTSNHEVVLKTGMNAREFRALRGLWLNDLTIEDANKENPKVSGMKGSILEKAENKAIELMVVSIDNKNTDILETLLNFAVDEYEEVIKAINEATASFGQKKKD